MKNLNFGHRERSKVNNRKLKNGIPCKWCETESLFQQKTVKKSHMGFRKKMKYLTFGDPEGSRSLTFTSDVGYLANGARELVSCQQKTIIKSHMGFEKS